MRRHRLARPKRGRIPKRLGRRYFLRLGRFRRFTRLHAGPYGLLRFCLPLRFKFILSPYRRRRGSGSGSGGRCRRRLSNRLGSRRDHRERRGNRFWRSHGFGRGRRRESRLNRRLRSGHRCRRSYRRGVRLEPGRRREHRRETASRCGRGGRRGTRVHCGWRRHLCGAGWRLRLRNKFFFGLHRFFGFILIWIWRRRFGGKTRQLIAQLSGTWLQRIGALSPNGNTKPEQARQEK